MSGARAFHTATPLPAGRVLVAGGGQTATLLSSGDVLVAGGSCGPPVTTGPQESALSVVEVYQAGGGWLQRPALATGRGFATATLLNDGSILIAGGFDNQGSPLRDAEIYTP